MWFFSDPHFGHANICLGSTNWPIEKRDKCRKFNSVEEMDNVIIDNINSCVKENDTVFCLGDWTFSDRVEEYRNRIKCHKLHLILGNHDKDIRNNVKLQSLFSSVHDYLEININEHHIIMSHYPIESWNRMRRGSFHLFGHQHSDESWKLRNGKKIDVGLDGNNYMPYSWQELYETLKDRENLIDQND